MFKILILKKIGRRNKLSIKFYYFLNLITERCPLVPVKLSLTFMEDLEEIVTQV